MHQGARQYEVFLGRFIDEAQECGADVGELADYWIAICPPEWRERFAGDLEEFATLLRDGTLTTTAVA